MAKPSGQKRDSSGRYTTTSKAKRVSSSAPRPMAVSPTTDVSAPGPKPRKKATAGAPPQGHMGDGISTVHEYVERVRQVYIAFRQRYSASR